VCLLLPVQTGESGEHYGNAVHDHPSNRECFQLLTLYLALIKWNVVPFSVLSRSRLKLAIAERTTDAADRAIDRKTEERFQNVAVAYQDSWK
jgi:hypothetical protein